MTGISLATAVTVKCFGSLLQDVEKPLWLENRWSFFDTRVIVVITVVREEPEASALRSQEEDFDEVAMFLLFGGDDYYPGGGMADFRGQFDSIEEAESIATSAEFNNDWSRDGKCEWWCVVDAETLENRACM